jgi:hypothetical protein
MDPGLRARGFFDAAREMSGVVEEASRMGTLRMAVVQGEVFDHALVWRRSSIRDLGVMG